MKIRRQTSQKSMNRLLPAHEIKTNLEEDQTCWIYRNLDDEVLKQKLTEGRGLTAKDYRKEPGTEELPALEQLMAEKMTD